MALNVFSNLFFFIGQFSFLAFFVFFLSGGPQTNRIRNYSCALCVFLDSALQMHPSASGTIGLFGFCHSSAICIFGTYFRLWSGFIFSVFRL